MYGYPKGKPKEMVRFQRVGEVMNVKINWAQLLLMYLVSVASVSALLAATVPVPIIAIWCISLGWFWPVPVFKFELKNNKE